MDWGNILADAGVVASVSTAIFMVIDFIKKLYYKLPWGWVQKTPGEVWFALSMILALGVGLGVYWDSFFGGEQTLSAGLSAATYGLISGAGSKLINSVASSAGAKLKAVKEVARSIPNTTVLGEAAKVTDVPPEVSEVASPTVEQRVEDTKKRIDEAIVVPNTFSSSMVELVKKMEVDADYVILDGSVYEVKKEK